MKRQRKGKRKGRRSIFDYLEKKEGLASSNKYCGKDDLSNEASVETFFVARLLKDLGYSDSEIRTKQSVSILTISLGRRKETYKPDYVIECSKLPRWLIDAKAPSEDVDDWIGQCSGYALSLNRKFTGEKPLRYYAITNGLVFKVFNWDEESPILELSFSDFVEDSQRFLALNSVLGANAVRAGWSKGSVKKPPTVTLSKPPVEQVKRLFNACHRLIWKTEKMAPQPAFFEFVKIMFVKLWEDRKLHDDPQIGPLIERGEPIPKERVIFSTDWIDSLVDKGIDNPIGELFEKLLAGLSEAVAKRQKKPIFGKGETIRLQPGTVREVVSRLEQYNLFAIDEDLNGRLFETFLSATMRGEALGQYFTPRSIVKLMEKLARPIAGRNRIDTVLDGCAGTGGFDRSTRRYEKSSQG